ncbi:MAG: Hcp1 family type VI secretion system effector [Luteitalea sp.]|nr:Hcp1 family type VI secretion system effector [Luteitalea sp.]
MAISDAKFPSSPIGAGAGDMFLKVKGIKGESQDQAHGGEIDVVRWSWGMQANTALGGGGASGKATVQELKIVKRVDSASTALMLALRRNQVIPEAVLTLRKAGGIQHEFLKITIKQGHVTSLNIEAGDTGGRPEPFEHVSFSFNEIAVEYTGQGNDGQPLGSMAFEDRFGTL